MNTVIHLFFFIYNIRELQNDMNFFLSHTYDHELYDTQHYSEPPKSDVKAKFL